MVGHGVTVTFAGSGDAFGSGGRFRAGVGRWHVLLAQVGCAIGRFRGGKLARDREGYGDG